MKATKQKRAYKPNVKCLCGNPAVANRCNGAVCERCLRIENAMKQKKTDRDLCRT